MQTSDPQALTTDSALFIGNVRHRRFMPKSHEFTYPLFMVWINLDQQQEFLAKSIFWSNKAYAPASFDQRNYLKPLLDYSANDLKQRAVKMVKDKLNIEVQQVCLLTHFRYFGFSFNPISCFYCYQEQQLVAIIAEVSNTPWGEAIHYVLDCRNQSDKQRLWFDKKMHVSPFNPMDMQYHWYSNTPDQQLSLHLETQDQRGKILDATLKLKRTPANAHTMQKILWQFPLMTLKVVWGIYWQALKLFIKKVPIFDHQPFNYQTASNSYRQGPLKSLRNLLKKTSVEKSTTTPVDLSSLSPRPSGSDKADVFFATEATTEHYDTHKEPCTRNKAFDSSD